MSRPVSRPSRGSSRCGSGPCQSRRGSGFAPLALAGAVAAMRLERRDRAFATELVYGVLRWRGRIDHYLQHFSNRPLKKISPWCRAALRLAVYQTLCLDSVPAPVACSESVLLVKEKEPWAAGFVNGVCRALSRHWREVPLPERESDPVDIPVDRPLPPRMAGQPVVLPLGARSAPCAVCQSNNRAGARHRKGQPDSHEHG